MINVYESLVSTKPIEQHDASGVTVLQWLRDAAGHDGSERVAVAINGKPLPLPAWGKTVIGHDDVVDVYPLPKKISKSDVLGFVTGGASILYDPKNYRRVGREARRALGLKPSIPGAPKMPGQGSALDAVNVQANTARLGEVVRQSFGENRIYPDYLNPPRRWYETARDQHMRVLLCVGAGEYDIPANQVKIGNTPLLALGDNASFTVYPPNANLSEEPAHEWWQPAAEVDGTSSAAGLELDATSSYSEPSLYEKVSLSGKTMVFTPAFVATGWEVGMQLSVAPVMPYDWAQDDGDEEEGRWYLSGNFDAIAPIVPNERIEVRVDEESAIYEIDSYDVVENKLYLKTTAGAPVDDIGFVGVGAASVGRVGFLYEVTNLTTAGFIWFIEVERIDDSGDIDASWQGFVTPVTDVDFTIALAGTSTSKGWTGPFTLTNQGRSTDKIELDFFFPEGLVKYNDKGDRQSTSQTVQVQWRQIGAPTWNTVDYSFSASTPDQVGYTREITLPSKMAIEMRAKRTGDGSGDKVRNKVLWQAARVKYDAPTSYPWTTIAIHLASSKKLSSTSESMFNLVARRRIREVTDDGYGAVSATRSIAAAVAEIAAQAGYKERDIDWAALKDLDDLWASRGETFNHAFSQTTVADALSTVLGAGMGALTLHDGVLTPLRDGKRTTFEQAFSAQNMTRGLVRSFIGKSRDEFDGVDVTFRNAENGFEEETIKIRLEGDFGLKAEEVTLEGVTDYVQAWRIGMRMRMAQKYQRWSYDFSTELEGLNCNYLSYISITDEVEGFSQSALVAYAHKSGDNVTIGITEPIELSGQLMCAWRNDKGELIGPFDCELQGQLLVVATDKAPEREWHFYLGTVDKWAFPAIVEEVTPSNLEVRISAVNYDERIYQYDDEVPN